MIIISHRVFQCDNNLTDLIMSQAYQEVPEWLEQVAEEAVGSSYGPAGGRFASKDRREVTNLFYIVRMIHFFKLKKVFKLQ